MALERDQVFAAGPADGNAVVPVPVPERSAGVHPSSIGGRAGAWTGSGRPVPSAVRAHRYTAERTIR